MITNKLSQNQRYQTDHKIYSLMFQNLKTELILSRTEFCCFSAFVASNSYMKAEVMLVGLKKQRLHTDIRKNLSSSNYSVLINLYKKS